MDGIRIDLTVIAAIWMGGLVLLVPLTGLVARYAVVPLLESVGRLRRPRGVEDLEARMDRIERRLEALLELAELEAGRRAA